MTTRDERFMAEALMEARACLEAGDSPFGAVLVRGDEIVARGRNEERSGSDPTAHAETMVIRNAAREGNEHRFPGATLYATWEPCPMCLGAIMNAEVARLVIGGRSPAAERRFGEYTAERLLELAGISERVAVTTGVMRGECEDLVARWRARQP